MTLKTDKSVQKGSPPTELNGRCRRFRVTPTACDDMRSEPGRIARDAPTAAPITTVVRDTGTRSRGW